MFKFVFKSLIALGLTASIAVPVSNFLICLLN